MTPEEVLRALGLATEPLSEPVSVSDFTNGAAENQGEALNYAFGHLTSFYSQPEDAHAADSRDEGYRVLEFILDGTYDAGFVIALVRHLAEHVGENYAYHGEGEAQRRAERDGA